MYYSKIKYRSLHVVKKILKKQKKEKVNATSFKAGGMQPFAHLHDMLNTYPCYDKVERRGSDVSVFKNCSVIKS